MRIENASFNVGQTISSSTDVLSKQNVAKPVKQVETIDQQPPVEMDNEAKKANDDKEANMEEDLLNKSIDQANKSLASFDRVIQRSVHEVTHTIMYTIRDTKTNEVICEFPPKKIQDMVAKMWELVGLFVDGRG